MPGGDTDRTEKATPKRRDEARKKGQVAVSKDLNHALQMMLMLLLFQVMGYWVSLRFTGALREYLGARLPVEMNDSTALDFLRDTVSKCMDLLLPFFVTLVVFMILLNTAQVGLKVSFEPLELDLGRLNPVKGLQKLFSMRAGVKLFWSVLKVAVLAAVVYWSLEDRLAAFGGLGDADLLEILRYVFSLLFLILFRVGLALVVLGVFDYLYQRWQYEEDLKMTKEEVKEELKQTIGDPLVKRRIRQVQYRMFRQRIMEKVPEATVVVTNPTAYAVAIKYERGVMNAPVVVAKGMNLIAQKIKEIGRKHGVPIVENRVLAQTLYRTVDVDAEVPPRLYRAVAEVLTYVYKLKGRL